ncbi:MAG: calcium-binding protein [Microcoleaceae cyanobacterium]
MSSLNPNDPVTLSGDNDLFTIPASSGATTANIWLALDGNDTVLGSAGAETINGNQGNDSVDGGGGADYIYGGKDNDTLSGLLDADTLSGNKGFDFLEGGDGDDLMYGGQAADVLIGGTGDDTLSGDRGLNGSIGGSGSDVFVLLPGDPAQPETEGTIIFDLNLQEGDQIALAGGLTEANLLLQEENRPISELLDLGNGLLDAFGVDIPSNLLPFLSNSAAIEQFIQTTVGVNISLDPDQDGNLAGTLIIDSTTAKEIGLVLNVAPDDLSGNFTTI